MIYLGELGRMVGIECPAEQELSFEAPHSFVTTLEGRVVARQQPAQGRAWSLDTVSMATPEEIVPLMDFASGAWGRGPWWFVSADAPVTNMLTPQAASCDPAVMIPTTGAEVLGTGPMECEPGVWAPRSVWKNTVNTVVLGGRVPVISGGWVTASGWVRGAGGAVRVEFFNASGTLISYFDSPTVTSGTRRVSVSRQVPQLATSARVLATRQAVQVARPALTWTPEVRPFADGQGCEKAVLSVSRRAQVRARPAVGQQFSSARFTVTEVG